MPCQNDGTCIDLVNGFKCECSDGFTDESCRPGLNTTSFHQLSISYMCNKQK